MFKIVNQTENTTYFENLDYDRAIRTIGQYSQFSSRMKSPFIVDMSAVWAELPDETWGWVGRSSPNAPQVETCLCEIVDCWYLQPIGCAMSPDPQTTCPIAHLVADRMANSRAYIDGVPSALTLDAIRCLYKHLVDPVEVHIP